jgi:hypothetical protein
VDVIVQSLEPGPTNKTFSQGKNFRVKRKISSTITLGTRLKKGLAEKSNFPADFRQNQGSGANFVGCTSSARLKRGLRRA